MAGKNMPKDLQVMSNILKDLGITDYESGVENHMLEFMHRYVTTIIEDSVLYSSHAKKKNIDIDDVKLAVELQQERNFTCPPSREITATLARQRNSLPLPAIRSSAGLRLPPDRFSLTQCNYQLKSAKKPRTSHSVSRLNASNTSTTPMIPRPTFNVQKPGQCPIIKFSEGNKATTTVSNLTLPSATNVTAVNSSGSSQILMPTVGVIKNEAALSNDVNPNKRPHDQEDDDYDNN